MARPLRAAMTIAGFVMASSKAGPVGPSSKPAVLGPSSRQLQQRVAGYLIHPQDLQRNANPQGSRRVVREPAEQTLQLSYPVAHGVVVVVQDAGRFGHVE